MDRAALSRAVWRKSSRSNGISNCVEIAGLRTGVGVRDSKAPGAGATLTLTHEHWLVFVQAIKAGGHDLP